jgi:hypothetical protein
MIDFVEPVEADESELSLPPPVFIGLVFGAVVISFSFVWAALYFLQPVTQ